MLQIGSPKAKIISEKLDGQEYEGVHFKVESTMGLTVKVSHNAKDDASAKTIVKRVVATIPELKNAYTNIQLIDANGRIL